jgi:DNA-binding MarR family transcriptional regulator
MPQITDPYQIIWLIRRLFRALAQKSDDSLKDLGITAADRAVMEFLHPDKRLAVPQIAQRYQVSRQHVQATVNHLVEAGLATARANPRHRRSSLIELTGKGKTMFRTIKSRDARAVRTLFRNVSGQDRIVTEKTLRQLLAEVGVANGEA